MFWALQPHQDPITERLATVPLLNLFVLFLRGASRGQGMFVDPRRCVVAPLERDFHDPSLKLVEFLVAKLRLWSRMFVQIERRYVLLLVGAAGLIKSVPLSLLMPLNNNTRCQFWLLLFCLTAASMRVYLLISIKRKRVGREVCALGVLPWLRQGLLPIRVVTHCD